MSDKPDNDDTYLSLPGDSNALQADGTAGDANPAADLIRQKVQAAYAGEPSASAEVLEAAERNPAQRSKHQKYIYDLTSSGKSLAEIQIAWHDYYAALNDVEKHQVWQEFYAAQAAESRPAATPALALQESRAEQAKTISLPKSVTDLPGTLNDIRERILSSVPRRPASKAAKKPINSALFGLGVGSIVILVLLFSFFNERFIAPFIQPSRTLSNVPLITDNSVVGPESEVIIPKINVEIPVVYDVNTINEESIDAALENGVVHYADTAMPGQNGNVVIVGHSSNNIFNKGRYKFAFVLLSRLEPGDTFYLQKDNKRYTYQIYQKKIVKPTDTSVLGVTDKPATATLITCDPPGTSINRLVVTGEQISPDPSNNSGQVANNSLATQTKIIPGNSESLWARFVKWLER